MTTVELFKANSIRCVQESIMVQERETGGCGVTGCINNKISVGLW